MRDESGGWRSFTRPAPSWEVKVWLPAPGVPTPKSLEFQTPQEPPTPTRPFPWRDLSGAATRPCWRCHRATTSLHRDVPRGWGRGSGEGHGVPGLTEHHRQPPAPRRAQGGRGCTGGVFLAFSLTESFQISLPLTSKRNERAAKRAWDFFSLPFQGLRLLRNIKVLLISVASASNL